MDPVSSEFVTAYCTVGSLSEARTIAKDLVQNRLAACVNILPGVESVYEWQGECCQDPELALIIKTRAANMPDVSDRIRQLHSYDCPCITAMPICRVTDDYAAWLRTQTDRQARS